METFEEYLSTIDQIDQRDKMAHLLNWISETFPQLDQRIAWNQPNFTDHGTFIIGFSAAKQHISVAPETAALEKFSDMIEAAGYSATKMLFRIKQEQEIDYPLLEEIIQFNIEDKKDCTTYWRKA
ncbi:iron chaperone [Marinilactibacillus piezotolerans]|uniref:iron chaperone n=1 Tax=Marinilactibacillus piezotolerans TaxID=258723 RepID=UPI0009B155EE|nr:DUF1801 domain-containing protein [Marinilactibacillus piezotolerans]